MKHRKLIGNIMIVLAVAFTVYLSIVMIHRINSVVLRNDYVTIFRYELFVCAVFLLVAFDVRFGFFTRMKPVGLKAVGWLMRILVLGMAAVFLFFMGRITVAGFINTDAPADKAIVLGLALENGEPTNDLISRLNTAEKFLERNPDAEVILTGGNPDESGRTEAAVMREILAGRGVPDHRMILEDQAEDTKKNFRNTAEIIDPDDPVVLISSNYHMDRAVRTARSAGFSDVRRLPAPSSFLGFGANVMWEVILELNELTLRQ